jgi:hypothetical protein
MAREWLIPLLMELPLLGVVASMEGKDLCLMSLRQVKSHSICWTLGLPDPDEFILPWSFDQLLYLVSEMRLWPVVTVVLWNWCHRPLLLSWDEQWVWYRKILYHPPQQFLLEIQQYWKPTISRWNQVIALTLTWEHAEVTIGKPGDQQIQDPGNTEPSEPTILIQSLK